VVSGRYLISRRTDLSSFGVGPGLKGETAARNGASHEVTAAGELRRATCSSVAKSKREASSFGLDDAGAPVVIAIFTQLALATASVVFTMKISKFPIRSDGSANLAAARESQIMRCYDRFAVF
jgi:hypothetical protein